MCSLQTQSIYSQQTCALGHDCCNFSFHKNSWNTIKNTLKNKKVAGSEIAKILKSKGPIKHIAPISEQLDAL